MTKPAQVEIHLQKRGFAVGIPVRRGFDWDGLTDAFLDLPGVVEVDGPLGNGVVGVVYEDERTDAELIAELQQTVERFFKGNRR